MSDVEAGIVVATFNQGSTDFAAVMDEPWLENRGLTTAHSEGGWHALTLVQVGVKNGTDKFKNIKQHHQLQEDCLWARRFS